jgi:hypothetical protein
MTWFLLAACLINDDLYAELSANFDTAASEDDTGDTHSEGRDDAQVGWVSSRRHNEGPTVEVWSPEHAVPESYDHGNNSASAGVGTWHPLTQTAYWMHSDGALIEQRKGFESRVVVELGEVDPVDLVVANDIGWVLTAERLYRVSLDGSNVEELAPEFDDARSIVHYNEGNVDVFERGRTQMVRLNSLGVETGTEPIADGMLDVFDAARQPGADDLGGCDEYGNIYDARASSSNIVDAGVPGTLSCSMDAGSGVVLLATPNAVFAFDDGDGGQAVLVQETHSAAAAVTWYTLP